eukprot:CAMPEP_0182920366 /NCGR_PEP_ID=MMETSP0105_2-20130417/3409_1 /TAXON_ID=81532 ORGANISM="Acanthoeca-like sp., Strain 10tr" /NCGR_SAMPLE_ID=MMETSP0105_2 /ASSEMBLY_ACC=CAM_ASM_000205 /LENGTH=714 /DNA_ID=CAMNT_0025057751 /DNA_START=31 /DNA_END=2171 /DNA_ORIENTATION=+
MAQAPRVANPNPPPAGGSAGGMSMDPHFFEDLSQLCLKSVAGGKLPTYKAVSMQLIAKHGDAKFDQVKGEVSTWMRNFCCLSAESRTDSLDVAGKSARKTSYVTVMSKPVFHRAHAHKVCIRSDQHLSEWVCDVCYAAQRLDGIRWRCAAQCDWDVCGLCMSAYRGRKKTIKLKHFKADPIGIVFAKLEVVGCYSGSVADACGEILPGDLLIAFDGVDIKSFTTLSELVRNKSSAKMGGHDPSALVTTELVFAEPYPHRDRRREVIRHEQVDPIRNQPSEALQLEIETLQQTMTAFESDDDTKSCEHDVFVMLGKKVATIEAELRRRATMAMPTPGTSLQAKRRMAATEQKDAAPAETTDAPLPVREDPEALAEVTLDQPGGDKVVTVAVAAASVVRGDPQALAEETPDQPDGGDGDDVAAVAAAAAPAVFKSEDEGGERTVDLKGDREGERVAKGGVESTNTAGAVGEAEPVSDSADPADVALATCVVDVVESAKSRFAPYSALTARLNRELNEGDGSSSPRSAPSTPSWRSKRTAVQGSLTDSTFYSASESAFSDGETSSTLRKISTADSDAGTSSLLQRRSSSLQRTSSSGSDDNPSDESVAASFPRAGGMMPQASDSENSRLRHELGRSRRSEADAYRRMTKLNAKLMASDKALGEARHENNTLAKRVTTLEAQLAGANQTERNLRERIEQLEAEALRAKATQGAAPHST